MTATLVRSILVAAVVLPATASADPESPRPNPPPAVTTRATPAVHANPRVKLSYRRFAIANLDGDAIWLDGAQLDVYMLSRRWVRIGIELEGGAGRTEVALNPIGLAYGIAGVTLGFQYPARVTPFVDGRFIGGALGGRLSQPLEIPGTSIVMTDVSAVTWIYGGGLDAGIELYTFGRMYLTMSVGWVRTTWGGIDSDVISQSFLAGVRWKDITSDSFTFKVGFGL